MEIVEKLFSSEGDYKKFKPNAVFGVGGYSSFPVLKQAQTKAIPTFIHESNAFAGKANQWLGADATQIFTGTNSMETFFPADKILVTGNPVRQNIIHTSYSKNNAVLHFGLMPNKNGFNCRWKFGGELY